MPDSKVAPDKFRVSASELRIQSRLYGAKNQWILAWFRDRDSGVERGRMTGCASHRALNDQRSLNRQLNYRVLRVGVTGMSWYCSRFRVCTE